MIFSLSLPFIIAFHCLSLLPFIAFHYCLSLPFITFHYLSLPFITWSVPPHQGTKALVQAYCRGTESELGHPTTAAAAGRLRMILS